MIDIAKLAESALPGHPNAASIMATVAPVLVAAVTGPIRDLHQPRSTVETLPNGVTVPWKKCSCGFRTHSACPTVRLADALDAAAGVVR